VADTVWVGSAMGTGQPIAGIAVRGEVVAEFGRTSRYFNTFGGNAVSCAAALAVLDAIEGEGLRANAAAMGARLVSALERLAERHAAITAVRGAGLMIGVAIAGADATARVVNGMREAGVLISSCGREHNVLKIRPPLTVGAAEIDLVADTLGQVLETLEGQA